VRLNKFSVLIKRRDYFFPVTPAPSNAKVGSAPLSLFGLSEVHRNAEGSTHLRDICVAPSVPLHKTLV
jgi:hypothetical protein